MPYLLTMLSSMCCTKVANNLTWTKYGTRNEHKFLHSSAVKAEYEDQRCRTENVTKFDYIILLNV